MASSHARGEEAVPLKTMVPVSVRGQGGGELGNQISFVFVDLPCDEPEPLLRLSRVMEEMGKRKRGGQPEGADRVLKALGYAPRTIQHALSHLVTSPRAFNITVSNIPGPPAPLYMLGCELDEVYPVVPIPDRHALAIGMTTLGGRGVLRRVRRLRHAARRRPARGAARRVGGGAAHAGRLAATCA